jgi:hypothetical protein
MSCSLQKKENRKVKQVLFGGRVSMGVVGYKEKGSGYEHGGNTVYTCM